MRFVHTADWQIGMKALHAAKAAPRVREARLEAACKVVEEARRLGADFLILAGDTFENNGIDRAYVRKVVDILVSFGAPVYVIPGNHDPWVPGSVWEHPAWKESQQIHVLLEPVPVPVTGGLLYPCPVREKHSTLDPTAWIRAEEATTVRVGVAHGTVETVHSEEPDYPISRTAAERAGLDYLALGHWHSTVLYDDSSGAVRMGYSGTPEPTGFGERASGNCLLVEIPGPGERPQIAQISTGCLQWLEVKEELRERGDLAKVRSRLENIGDPSRVLLALSLSGVLDPEEQAELDIIQEILGARFLYWRLDDADLLPAPADVRWIEKIPPGHLREAAKRLAALSAVGRGWDPSDHEETARRAAAQALRILYAVTREKGR